MDLQQDRQRSSSINNKNLGLSPSASPHLQYRDPVSGQEIDPNLVATTSTNNAFATGTFADSGVPNENDQYIYNPYQELNPSAQSQHLQPVSHTSPPADQQFASSFEASFATQLEHSANTKRMQSEDSFSNPDPNRAEDFPLYQNINNNGNNPQAQDIDPSLMFDPQYQPSPPVNQSVNPADLVSDMSSPHNPSPPNLVPPETYSSPGQPSSPATPGTYYTPQHSRHASLDPSSAFMTAGQGQADWQGMLENPSFQGHRRTPSEHSDVSSVTHSPYMSHQEFDPADNNPSPHLTAQNDQGLYDNALAIEGFSISEPQPQRFSPAHSPYISPQLSPQQIGDFGPENNFLNTPNAPFPQMAPDPYGMNNEEVSTDMGQAAQMAPPSINVELAPPGGNSNFEMPKSQTDMDALIPPIQRSMYIEIISLTILPPY